MTRVAIALNPRAAAGSCAVLWSCAQSAMTERNTIVARVETRGDAGDVDRIAAALNQTRPDVLAAAGGDGTMNDAVTAILHAGETRPALALLPLGTGNNVARSLGLLSFRSERNRAVDLAVAAIVNGRRREIDIGMANHRPFAGSFAIGMDADILALRNRLRRRFRLTGEAGGYALYLLSAAASLCAAHGGRARLVVDGDEEHRGFYGIAVINAPIYAGEFRFDADNDCADGLVGVHTVSGPIEYVSEYPRAWRRHLRVQRGEAAVPSPLLRQAREVDIELDRPAVAHVDGEELGASATYRIRVLPRALTVCVPA